MARLSKTDSPPVQPISSSTSGTGSVISMWLEVTVSRSRKGEPAEARAPPIASTAAGAITVPEGVTASTPPAVSRSRCTGERSKRAAPRSSSRRRSPAARRAGCTVAASAKSTPPRNRGERQRFATSASESSRKPTSAPAPRSDATAAATVASWAGAAETWSRPALRYQASTSCSAQKRPIASTESSEARAIASAASEP